MVINPEIAEINLIGTGGGYGESIIIHIGNNEWVVVDSCQNPFTKESLPVNFFIENKIDFKNVKLIICTHWHDDHLKGLCKLLELCSEAIFSCARANDLEKFLRFVSLDYEKYEISTSNSSTIEFNKCLNIIKDRGQFIKFSARDMLLYSSRFEDQNLEIYSLSPSDMSSQLFDLQLSTLMRDYCQLNRKVPSQSPNSLSVVLYLKLGHHCFLLGSDLERSNSKDDGWDDIILNSQVVKVNSKCIYFKIPHHGSENGYHEEQWTKLVIEKPIGTLTPWNKNKQLPKEKMISKYKSVTNELYITSILSNRGKAKKRNNRIEKTIKEFNSTITEVKYHYGLVKSKINILHPTDSIINSTVGTAVLL